MTIVAEPGSNTRSTGYLTMSFTTACKSVSLIAFLAAGFVSCQSASGDSGWTMRLELRGQRIEGMPLYAGPKSVLLLGRDGHLWDFPPSDAKNFSKISSTFRSYTQGEMRGQLMGEFGRQYNVTGTGHYLVVHPAGQRDHWAGRFELLYRSFQRYFTARGIRPTPPQFPLVAVVFPTRREFQQYAAKQGMKLSPTVLGFYSFKTNRVALYDITAGRPDAQSWHVNAATIIHEATHQTAYNTSIHNRFGDTPVWLAEGLATMFEAPGVWDSRRQTKLKDRVSSYWLKRFRAYDGRSRKTWLPALIASNAVFNTSPDAAYARSWALTFYLTERQARQYGDYLRKTVRRPAGESYTPKQRLADFTSVFGDNWTMLETRVNRFVAELPK
jgi:hypothetical protein